MLSRRTVGIFIAYKSCWSCPSGSEEAFGIRVCICLNENMDPLIPIKFCRGFLYVISVRLFDTK